jgi:hypothetical protein
MESSLISTFASLSIILGLLVGFGTLSVVRGIFTFLIFIGLTMSQLLGTVGVNEYVAYFLGQIIVMLPVYLMLRRAYPETLVKVKQELQTGSAKCH